MKLVEGLKKGFRKAENIMTERQDYRHSVLNKNFYRDVTKGIKKIDPITGKEIGNIVEPVKDAAEFAGAYAARLMTDIGTDGTRQFYWRYVDSSQSFFYVASY